MGGVRLELRFNRTLKRMAATLKLEIITPEATTYSDDVDMVTLPGLEGEMGIFPQHVPLMTQILPGEVIVRKDGKEQFLAVGEGFVEITGARVAILTDMAIKADDIDEVQAEEARRRAESRLQQKISDEDMAAANAAITRSIALLQVKRRHKK
jgi:F-type H+-transporting ATPase subunit epsilon